MSGNRPEDDDNARVDAEIARLWEQLPPDNPLGVIGVIASRRSASPAGGDPVARVQLIVASSEKDVHRRVDGPVLRDLLQRLKPEAIGSIEAISARSLRPRRPLPWQLSGVHPGAPMVASGGAICGVACVLGKGGRPTHLVTAGHVFPRVHAPSVRHLAAYAGDAGCLASVCIGQLVRNFIDRPPAGRSAPLDAAVVELWPGGAAMASRTLARGPLGPRIDDICPRDTLDGLRARVFSPRTGRPSPSPVPVRDGREEAYRVSASPVRAAFSVRDVVKTDAITQDGDSGTLLYTDLEGGGAGAVGLCVGRLGAESLFTPFAPVLQSVRAEIDGALEVWPHGSSTR